MKVYSGYLDVLRFRRWHVFAKNTPKSSTPVPAGIHTWVSKHTGTWWRNVGRGWWRCLAAASEYPLFPLPSPLLHSVHWKFKLGLSNPASVVLIFSCTKVPSGTRLMLISLLSNIGLEESYQFGAGNYLWCWWWALIFMEIGDIIKVLRGKCYSRYTRLRVCSWPAICEFPSEEAVRCPGFCLGGLHNRAFSWEKPSSAKMMTQ